MKRVAIHIATRTFPRFLLVSYLALLVGCLATADMTRVIGLDFMAFWAASYLALAGEPAAAYDAARQMAVHVIAIGRSQQVAPWHYPPTYQLLILPLALLPYVAAWGGWVSGTLAAYAAVIRQLAPRRPESLLLIFTFPVVLGNALLGQNGLLTSALLGAALLALPARPVLAGVLIGVLSIKPHLGLLIPIALIFGRQWRAFASAAATTLVLAACSVAVLGIEPWIAFLNDIPTVRPLIDAGQVSRPNMPSVYATLISLGIAHDAAAVVHGIQAILVIGAVAWTWNRAPMPLAGAVLACGAVMVPPYVFNYDLALLAI
ncbi:MAG TPA: glycosyltransferase family 87 protein, partial [Ramlibacter sp.]